MAIGKSGWYLVHADAREDVQPLDVHATINKKHARRTDTDRPGCHSVICNIEAHLPCESDRSQR